MTKKKSVPVEQPVPASATCTHCGTKGNRDFVARNTKGRVVMRCPGLGKEGNLFNNIPHYFTVRA